MTAPATSTATSNLGFLAIINDPSGTLGGCLITNAWGRPLEFRLTSAVQPNRVQHILYGATLQHYICGELIAKTLLDKSTTPTQWLFVDHPAALDLRLRVSTPVSLWLPGDVVPPENVVPAGRNLYVHGQFPDDAAAVQALVEKLGNLDLGEPFQRVRDAMQEARKMGVAKATPLAA